MNKKELYAEKLKSPLWQKTRLSIMGRDEFKCRMCGCKDQMLSVHHRHYLIGREPWDYPDELLVTLCQPCHQKEEKAAGSAQDILNTMHHWGFFNVEIIDVFNKMIESKIAKM